MSHLSEEKLTSSLRERSVNSPTNDWRKIAARARGKVSFANQRRAGGVGPTMDARGGSGVLLVVDRDRPRDNRVPSATIAPSR